MTFELWDIVIFLRTLRLQLRDNSPYSLPRDPDAKLKDPIVIRGLHLFWCWGSLT
jgi:hypothetical protein